MRTGKRNHMSTVGNYELSAKNRQPAKSLPYDGIRRQLCIDDPYMYICTYVCLPNASLAMVQTLIYLLLAWSVSFF